MVLPSALWGEKTGTFTNVDRTVHLSEKAVDPPGEARSDLDIWVDYARRMGFTDRSGRPIPRWDTPEAAFDGWRECSRGRPCDYSGMSYELLRGSGGIQWPCTDDAPEGTERIYTDHQFNTADDYCESYGHDLLTGASVTPTEHRGGAVRRSGPAEGARRGLRRPSSRPRTTRWGWAPGARSTTSTRAPRPAARRSSTPQPQTRGWRSLPRTPHHSGSPRATSCGWSRRAVPIEAQARVSNIRPGAIFVPFHYGDADRDGGPSRAANELTITAWDPVSKQPAFKGGAVRVTRVSRGNGASPAPDNTASAPASREG